MDVPQYVRVDNDSRRVGHQSQVADPGIQRFLGSTTVWSRQDIEIDQLVVFTSKDGRIEASLNTTSSADIESNAEGQICHLCAFGIPPLYTSHQMWHLSPTLAAGKVMDNNKKKCQEFNCVVLQESWAPEPMCFRNRGLGNELYIFSLMPALELCHRAENT